MIAWRTFSYPAAALAILLGACGDNEEPSTGLSAASNNGSSSGSESGGSGSSGGSTNVQPTDGGSESASEGTTNSTPGPSTDPGTSTDATTTTTTTTTSTTGMPGACGDGMINPNEQCDGANLNGFDCTSLGAGGGTLACDPMSCTFDTSMCEPNGGTTG